MFLRGTEEDCARNSCRVAWMDLDYEIVELLLTLGTPRRDCKAMAKAIGVSVGELLK